MKTKEYRPLPERAEINFETIKDLSKKMGKKFEDLLVLAPKNDPFAAGSAAGQKRANWFKKLWDAFGWGKGFHTRKGHYEILSNLQASMWPPMGVDGKPLPYENTDRCWDYLCEASKSARLIGLVDAADFVDRRNPEPHIYMAPRPMEQIKAFWDFPDWTLPGVEFDKLDWKLPEIRIAGYEYHYSQQPRLIEIWTEKSTMNDILLPLAEKYAVNLVTGLGFMSVTSIVNLLNRHLEIGKPCRILYVSDFDPAGVGMPFQVARHIEFWNRKRKDKDVADIKLEPIVLTRAQVDHYKLPRIPIKESDLRANNFSMGYGEGGAVELDALEALHPGELNRIVEQWILKFRDTTLEGRTEEAKEQAADAAATIISQSIEVFTGQVTELKKRVRQVVSNYQIEMSEELKPFQIELDTIRLAVETEMREAKIALPELPDPITRPETGEWLFDGNRDYFTQLGVYKKRKNKE